MTSATHSALSPAWLAGKPRSGGRVEGGGRVFGLSKGKAEDLLDWLEAHGWSGWVVVPKAGEGFTVEYETRDD
jgi:hypothetical protein